MSKPFSFCRRCTRIVAVRSPRLRECGVALIVVLLVLALVTAVVVGFLVRAGSNRAAASSYSVTTSTRQLAESTVNLVQGKINEATSRGSSYAWASQPGAIRVYDGNGVINNIYRLYSGAVPVAPPVVSSADLANDLPPTSWAGASAQWVDLNAPTITDAGGTAYPILDPRNLTAASPPLDGFSLPTTGTSVPGATAVQAAPMPVRWLYTLQNGAIVAPDLAGASGTSVTVPGASATNPITGRIAYWTDDESCKVNVNTAGGDGLLATAGNYSDIADKTFWSPPYFCAPDEVKLATYQPAAGELQRYSGHPATVAMNNVLRGLGWSLGSQQFYQDSTSTKGYGVTPRYAYGGSSGNTVMVNAATSVPLAPSNRLYPSVSEMLFNPDRTASTLNDGTANTRQRAESARFFLTAHSRAPETNLFGMPRISVWPVWDSTTQSPAGNLTIFDRLLSFSATMKTSGGTASAPYYFTRKDCASATTDVNLPRNQTLLSYLDRLTGTSTPLPGFGGNFQDAAVYGVSRTRQIITEIFDYVRLINIADNNQTSANGASGQYIRAWIPSGQYFGRFEVAPTVNAAWGTQGFGVYPRLTEAAVQFVGHGTNVSDPAKNIALSANYTTAKLSSLGLIGAGDSGTGTDAGKTSIYLRAATDSQATTPATYSPPAGTTAVQAFLLLQFTIPAQMRTVASTSGSDVNNRPIVGVQVSGLNNFKLNGHNLSFPAVAAMNVCGNISGDACGGQTWGNVPFIAMTEAGGASHSLVPTNSTNYLGGYTLYSSILPISIDITNPSGGKTMSFTGGTLTIQLYDGSQLPGNQKPNAGTLVQTYTIKYPDVPSLPIPSTMTSNTPPGSSPAATWSPTVNYTNPVGGVSTMKTGFSSGITNVAATSTNVDRWYTGNQQRLQTEGVVSANNDVIESMVLSPGWSDARTLAVSNVPDTAFVTHPMWGQRNAFSLMYNEFNPINRVGVPPAGATPVASMGMLVNGISASDYASLSDPNNKLPHIYPTVPPTLNASTGGAAVIGGGDWDNGLGPSSDGPWINKADEGQIFPASASVYPYYTLGGSGMNGTGQSFFSPNRQIPSPGMFGSLPTGIDPSGVNNPVPWRTLLFRPSSDHFGDNSTPGTTKTKAPDHLWMDFFWMPVVEPYAISEPFSTAGKVNLNYQIVPFTYITRNTALRAVLGTEKIAKVGGGDVDAYKLNSGPSKGGGMGGQARWPLNVDATLAQFDAKFKSSDSNNNFFKSASQICEMYLIPQGYSDVASFKSDWNPSINQSTNLASNPFALVGDNVRERPYTNIYSRVTTKSNTFQVYYTVQTLKATPNMAGGTWDETKGAITGEYRGSTIIDRFIDPNTAIPDCATSPNAVSLETYYRWRVLEHRRFAP